MRAFILASFLIVSVFSSSFLSTVPEVNVTTPNVKNTSEDLMQFGLGFYLGSNLNAHIPTFANCLLDALNVVTHLNDTYNSFFAALAEENPRAIGEAVVTLSLFLNETVTYCGDGFLDGQVLVAELVEDAKNLTYVGLAVERIGANLPTVLVDLQTAYDGVFQEANYFAAGKALGDVVRIFFDIQPAPSQTILLSLGSVNWPFTNCGGSSDALSVSSMTLDSQPSKGNAEGVNIFGTIRKTVQFKQVQIVTSLNGTPLNTQYDANTKAYQAGDSLNYRFSVSIPGFAPSVNYYFYFIL